VFVCTVALIARAVCTSGASGVSASGEGKMLDVQRSMMQAASSKRHQARQAVSSG